MEIFIFIIVMVGIGLATLAKKAKAEQEERERQMRSFRRQSEDQARPTIQAQTPVDPLQQVRNFFEQVQQQGRTQQTPLVPPPAAPPIVEVYRDQETTRSQPLPGRRQVPPVRPAKVVRPAAHARARAVPEPVIELDEASDRGQLAERMAEADEVRAAEKTAVRTIGAADRLAPVAPSARVAAEGKLIPAGERAKQTSSILSDILVSDRGDLEKAILLSEILDRPVSRRGSPIPRYR